MMEMDLGGFHVCIYAAQIGGSLGENLNAGCLRRCALRRMVFLYGQHLLPWLHFETELLSLFLPPPLTRRIVSYPANASRFAPERIS